MEDFLIETARAKSATFVSLRENVVSLKNKIEELSSRESDVLEELKKAELQCRTMPKKKVELWLESVQKFKDEVPDIEQKLRELKWYHILPRYNLASRVKEKIEAADELIEKVRFQGGLLIELSPRNMVIFPTENLVGETTAQRNLKMLEECVTGVDARKIGVCGMGGVGKTAIMTHIHNKIKNAKTFDHVIWVTVSKESTLEEELQYRVAKALDIERFEEYDNQLSKSAIILQYFERRGKFLLILDDLWHAFRLKAVGIPEPDEENKCKIVWTTRSKKVCRVMDSQRTIEVSCLTKEESWALFKEKLGTNFELSPEIEPTAKKVVEECGGLPLAIITVGAAMRNMNEICVWKTALEDLRNSRPELEGLEDDVFSCLRFSFDKLKTQRHRDCFLHCALYPEDAEIDCDKLIEYWMADGLFDENDEIDEIEDRKKVFEKGYTIINDLKEACMLENGHDKMGLKVLHIKKGRIVKVHDLLRDLAIAITRKSPLFFVKTGLGVRQFPKGENLMEDVVRISLMSSDIEMISCQPKCPKLRTLLLNKCIKLKSIDDLFLDHMPNLRVLDLSYTSITCLPQSLSNLVQLRALLLRCCDYLEEISSLVDIEMISCQPKCPNLRTLDLRWCANLKNIDDLFFDHMPNLRVLNLSGSSITCLPQSLSNLVQLRALVLMNCSSLVEIPSLVKLRELRELELALTKIQYLPEGMDGLTNLRRLNIGFTKLERFPPGMISNFSFIEELFMGNTIWKWSSNTSERGADVEEISRLTHLREVSLNFKDLTALSSFVRSRDWQDIKFFILYVNSDARGQIAHPSSLNYVQIYGISECMSSLVVPKSTESLAFSNCDTDDFPPLSEIPCFWSLKQLEKCYIRHCFKMEYIVTKAENPFLPSLSKLKIERMDNFKTICKDPTQGGTTLANLKRILISDCPKLEYVFWVGWLQTLQCLEQIEVRCCKAVEKMVAEDMVQANNNNITITLPRLKKLFLHYLPQLQSISKRILVCNSLESIEVCNCPKLNMLPFSMNNIPPSLKRISGSITWWDSLEWDNPNTKLHLQPFFKSPYPDTDYEISEEEDDDINDVADAVDEQRGTKRKADALTEEEDDDDDEDAVATGHEEPAATFHGAAHGE